MSKNSWRRMPLIVVAVMILVVVGFGLPDIGPVKIGPLKMFKISLVAGELRIEFYPPQPEYEPSKKVFDAPVVY